MEEVPLPGIGPEGYRQQGHVGLLRCEVVLGKVAVPAGGHDVFPAVPATAGCGVDVVAGQLAARELCSTIQAAVVVATEQGAITQWWGEALQYAALYGDDGLQVDA